MDSQQQAFVDVVQQAVQTIEQARTEQGWTAGAVALVLLFCIVGLAWMVRRLCLQVDEFGNWRQTVLQGQVENTTRALELSASGLDQFGHRLDANTSALRENTGAVRALGDAIRAAPCGRDMEEQQHGG